MEISIGYLEHCGVYVIATNAPFKDKEHIRETELKDEMRVAA